MEPEKPRAGRARGGSGRGAAPGGHVPALVRAWTARCGCRAAPAATTIRGEGVNAWQAFAVIDVLLLIAAVAALALVVVRVGRRGSRVDARGARHRGRGGVVCAVLVVYRLLDPPDLGPVVGGDGSEVGRRLGPFFALLATAAISWGAFRALAPEVAQPEREAEPSAEPVPEPEPEPVPEPVPSPSPCRSREPEPEPEPEPAPEPVAAPAPCRLPPGVPPAHRIGSRSPARRRGGRGRRYDRPAWPRSRI